MPQYSVNVKWGRQTFSNIEMNTDEKPQVFKELLYSLTGVTPERQKITVKGVAVKDTWENVPVINNITILLMGSKEDVPVEPGIKTRFIEDMNESELNTVYNLPAGLSNLGNTCYMNATVQCLKTVPELRLALTEYKGNSEEGIIPSHSVTAALRDLYEIMEKGTPVPPILFLQTLHKVFPRFAELNEKGSFVQQDANECWTQILEMLRDKLPAVQKEDFKTKSDSFINQFFEGFFEVEYKCTEAEDEPVTTSEESFLQLSCFISHDVRYVLAGLKSKLIEKIIKKSQCLNRDADFRKTSKISRLPAYLTVQFVRFYYKGKESTNAKILKEVKFPFELDVYELCTPDLQQKLSPVREKFEKQMNSPTKINKRDGKPSEINAPKPEAKPFSYSFPEDLGSNNSGYYSLQAILTHRGRSSCSGHYVSWVKQNQSFWVKCDDDVVTPVTEDEIMKLCGGGDWHCAYVLLYGPKILEPEAELTEIST